MLKSILHKGFSILLTVLVVFSTVSFTVEKHFCGDTLIDTAIFSKAKKCHMGALELEHATITKKKCCKDSVDLITGQDKLSTDSFKDLKISKQLVATVPSTNYTALFISLPKQAIPHIEYSPPNLIKNIQVLDQIFLI